jgi:hypothetical protein
LDRHQIADGLHTSPLTVARVRQQLVEEGVDGVLICRDDYDERILRDRLEGLPVEYATSPGRRRSDRVPDTGAWRPRESRSRSPWLRRPRNW